MGEHWKSEPEQGKWAIAQSIQAPYPTSNSANLPQPDDKGDSQEQITTASHKRDER
ncbi:hypothetical protein H6G33_12100 [Calothrix sp. FACHB-1219]|uniref:hypothetical protein n=1 Tax=unclassified Calothrix TaxID=2619626 RepID=UPI00168582A0|nr:MULTISPECIES: hypothetical protein [unclassified Calothrix]MBD2202368.1 hypothetical protein [Calothrix sp. FACHB-168]MBD2217774.1 hypothetical protein [Calothrix sp. FACHB-1219]